MSKSVKLNSVILILTALLALAACVPLDSTPTADMNKTLLDLQATQAVVNEIARQQTAAAGQATQTVLDRQATSTQQAVEATNAQVVRETQAIQTLSVDQTKQAWSITQQAAYGNATSTQQFINNQSTLDAAAVQAQSTAVFAQASTADAAARREQMVNDVRAWFPYATAGALLIVLVFIGIKLSSAAINRLHWIKRDERGDAPIRDDGRMIYDPDRNPGAALVDQTTVLALALAMIKARTGIDLSVPASAVVDPKTTERDQMVDLATRGLPNSPSRKSLPPGLQRALTQQQKYTVYGVDQQPPLDQDTKQVLSQDWTDAQSWD